MVSLSLPFWSRLRTDQLASKGARRHHQTYSTGLNKLRHNPFEVHSKCRFCFFDNRKSHRVQEHTVSRYYVPLSCARLFHCCRTPGQNAIHQDFRLFSGICGSRGQVERNRRPGGSLREHPVPDSEKMELLDNDRLGAKERDATQDYPESSSETSVVRIWPCEVCAGCAADHRG